MRVKVFLLTFLREPLVPHPAALIMMRLIPSCVQSCQREQNVIPDCLCTIIARTVHKLEYFKREDGDLGRA